MAPVILSMDVHCASCAKKIQKAVKKMPGVESVLASCETGLVVVEGAADAEALSARLRAKVGKPVTVVSDGAEDGDAGTTAGGSVASSPPPAPAGPSHWSARRAPEPAPAAAPPILLGMDLHCGACAKKVRKAVLDVPGVEAVTTDVGAGRVEVTGTADAAAVATSVEVRTRRAVTVLSDPWSAAVHEGRKAAAARAAAEQMAGYNAAWDLEQDDSDDEPAAGSVSPAPPSSPPAGSEPSTVSAAPPTPPPRRRRRRTRGPAPAPAPPVEPVGGGYYEPPRPYPYPTTYPSETYYYPGQEVYGVQQHWAAPYPSPEGYYYPGPGAQAYGGRQWASPEGYYSGHGGDAYTVQHWEAPYELPAGCHPGHGGGGGVYGSEHHMYHDENEGASCSIQ
ncbi:hypothetical protein ACP70R_019163 [Stipagrostis hirtigluma subsp. patula]